MAAIADALRERSVRACAPCTFETVALDTYVGEVEGLERLRFATGLAAYDCRNNRLAQLGLEQDGFARRRGARARKIRRRRASAFSWEPARRACCRPSSRTAAAIRQRARCRRFRYARNAQHVFARRFRSALSASLRGRRCRRLLRVLLERQGVRQRGAHDRRRRVRCRRRRRRRYPVPDDAVRLQFAGAHLAPALPPLRRRARRDFDRRGRGLRAARKGRRGESRRRRAAAGHRRELRRLPHVHAASGGPRRQARDAAGARRRPGLRPTTSTTSICTGPRRRPTMQAEDMAVCERVRRQTAGAARPKARPGTAGRGRNHRGDHLDPRDRARLDAGQPATRNASIRRCGANYLLENRDARVRPCAQQFVRLRRQQLQSRPGSRG